VKHLIDNWCTLPTPLGKFRMYDTGNPLVRLISCGPLEHLGEEALIRVHSSCIASEIFGALDCDCADQLHEAMQMITTEKAGLIFHLDQEGRGHGLAKKIQAVGDMEKYGLDTVESFERQNLKQDIRDYATVTDILRQLNISRVRLISNNPAKKKFLLGRGFLVEQINTHPCIRPENEHYLKTKNSKLNHNLPLEDHVNDTPIHFYHSDQAWGYLSNFSRHPVFISNTMWPTVEHFYQAQKFLDTTTQETIRLCITPTLAKETSTEAARRPERRPGWEEDKEVFMMQGLRAKFEQHPDLRKELINTGTRVLIEHSFNDSYWGDAGDGTGHNRLGQLLMQLRSEFC